MILMEEVANDLVEYLDTVLNERRLSQRAFAMYVGVSSSTISRVMGGEDADPATLKKIADYLQVPARLLFEKAGYIEQDNIKVAAIAEIEHLLEQMPEEAQREILEMIRLQSKLYKKREHQQE